MLQYNFLTMKKTLTFLFILFGVALQAQTVRLEFKPVAGTDYTANVSVVQTMTIKVPMMGDMTTVTTQEMSSSMKLVEKVDKGYLMEAIITRMVIKATGQGQSQEFSSEAEDVQGVAMRSVMNRPFRAVVSAQGEVVEVMPLDTAFYSGIDPALAAQYAKRKRETLTTQIKSLFSEAVLKSAVQAGLTKFPDKDIKVPSAWTQEDEEPSLSATTTTQYRFVSLADGVATFDCQVLLIQNPDAKPDPKATQRMEGLSGKGPASVKVTAADGWIVEGTTTQNIAGDLVIEQGGQTQRLPIVMKIESKVTR